MFTVVYPDVTTGVYTPADGASFASIDDALDSLSIVLDDTDADVIVRLYDNTAVIGQYRGRMQSIDADYSDWTDIGPAV